MRPASASATIDAPRERVFDLICDFAARPAFTDHFLRELRIQRLDPVGVGAGARFRVGDDGPWMDTVIDVAERPHLIRESGRGGRLNRVPTHTVWELAEGPVPGTTELTVTFWTEPSHPLDRVRELRGTARRVRRGFRRATTRLKDLAESGEPPPRLRTAGGERVPSMPVG
jgi:uncharacterized protein YndB with AHSA1/START domain